MAEVKRKAGRPKKEVELANKMEAAELKMKELEVVLATRVTAAHEKLVTEFEDHIAFISDVAYGRVKGATVNNRMKAAEMMIKRVDELKEKLELEEIDANSLEDPLGESGEGDSDGHDENVIQFR